MKIPKCDFCVIYVSKTRHLHMVQYSFEEIDGNVIERDIRRYKSEGESIRFVQLMRLKALRAGSAVIVGEGPEANQESLPISRVDVMRINGFYVTNVTYTSLNGESHRQESFPNELEKDAVELAHAIMQGASK